MCTRGVCDTPLNYNKCNELINYIFHIYMNIIETLENNFILFKGNKIYVIIDDDGRIWFRANDIANILGYVDPKETIKKYVSNEDKKQIKYINVNFKSHPQTIYLNEAGLYNLIFRSKKEISIQFKKWITSIVLPSIRQHGYYKIKKEHETTMHELLKKINYLENENNLIKDDLKKDIYPHGAIVYIINYSTDEEEIYRLGKTDNPKYRMQIYNTHSLHKKQVLCYENTECPLRLEKCLQSMLYKFRYKNKKDFYICNKTKVLKAFEECKKSINCIDQDGGRLLIHNLIKKCKKKVADANVYTKIR